MNEARSKDMKVAMMRTYKSPGRLGRMTSLVCDHFGVEFFFFNPEDVNFKKKTINGQFYINGRWRRQETSFPLAVDNEVIRDQKFMQALDKECYLTCHFIGSKKQVFERLASSNEFNDVLIPHKTIQSVQDIYDFTKEHGRTLLKPIVSNGGRNIYTVKNVNKRLELVSDDSSERLTKSAFTEFYEQTIKPRVYIAQPFIKSRNNQGDPFDIRMHVRKNLSGNWQNAAIYPRIGIGKGITSNISQGGGVSPLNSFLESRYGDSWQEVRDNLFEVSSWFPKKFEAMYDFDFDAFGIDFGLDENGKPWLFEVNTSPGVKYFVAEDAELRAHYLIYCAGKYGIDKTPYFKSDWKLY